jgi:ribosomal protein L37E
VYSLTRRSQHQLCCRVHYIVRPKNCTHCSKVMAQKLREWTYGQAAVHRVFTPMLRPKLPRRGEMIEFLAQMPSETMIFITTALLGLGATLIGLKWLI